MVQVSIHTYLSFKKLSDSVLTFLCGYLDQDGVLAIVHVNREFIYSSKNGSILSYLVIEDVVRLPKGITLLPSLSQIGKHLNTLKWATPIIVMVNRSVNWYPILAKVCAQLEELSIVTTRGTVRIPSLPFVCTLSAIPHVYSHRGNFHVWKR